MTTPLFHSLDSAGWRGAISVFFTAPGIQQEPANAIADVARRLEVDRVAVCLDFDERVIRIGFGSLPALMTLRDAEVTMNSTISLRTGLVTVDHEGYI